MADMAKRLKSTVRDVPNFPKQGIIFKDITTLLNKKEMFREAVDSIARKFRNKRIDVVVSVEARGFIFGAAVAYALGSSVVPVRKKGKLPSATYSVTYDLEYGQDTLEIHRDAFPKGSNCLLVDDLLATGGTTKAVLDLIAKLGGKVAGIAFVIELTALKGREKLKGYPILSLIKDPYC